MFLFVKLLVECCRKSRHNEEMSIESALQSFGLTPRQSRIYLSLLKLGKSSVSTVAKQTGIPRVSVYPCLDELSRLGVVSCITKNRRQLYEAQAPEMLLQILRQRSTLFESILPLFAPLMNRETDSFAVQVYEGAEQSKQAVRDFYEYLQESKIRLVYAFAHVDLIKTYPRYVPQMIQRRQQMGISTQLLVAAEQRKAMPSSYRGLRREVRFLPPQFALHCTMQIAGEECLFTVTENKEPVVLRVHSKAISTTMASAFRFLWDAATVA